jgi:hypothetical protein
VTVAHPPPPWRLRGEAAVLLAPVRVAATRAAHLPPGLSLLAAGGWTVGGLLLARYDETATLAYHELIVFSGLARAGARTGAIVSQIYVDSPASQAGGRQIWGLPKELAEFGWSPNRVTVRQGGTSLLDARLRRRSTVATPLPLLAPAFGTLAGRPALAVGRGTLRGGPVLARIDVPAQSPFAGLGLAGTRIGLAGAGLDLHFPAPR